MKTHFGENYVDVTYVDGVTERLSPTEFAISEELWKLVPSGHISSSYSLLKYYTEGFFTDGSISSVLKEIFYDIIMGDIPKKRANIAKFTKGAMVALSKIYNEIGLKSKEYEITISLEEILEIQLRPALTGAIDELVKKKDHKSIQEVYNALDDIMKHDPELDENMVAMSYISKTINPRQVGQCLGTRGVAADLDSTIFEEPVISNYALGLYDMYELAVDSRSASTALFYSTTSIQDSEVFAKQMQIACSVLENVTDVDCGATEGMKFRLTGPGINIYGEPYPGDLKFLTGIYYKTETDTEWKQIFGDEVELYGTEVQLRTVLNCKHRAGNTVCSKCFGPLSHHKQPGFIAGLWIISKLTDLLNQVILSTKHHIASAMANKTILDETGKKYFIVNESELRLRKDKIKPTNFISVPLSEFYGFKDINKESIKTVNHSRVSKLTGVTFITKLKTGKVSTDYIQLKQGDRYALFTLDFLKYILDSEYEITDGGDIIIPLKNWKSSKDIFTLPKTTFDYRSYGKEVREAVTGGDNDVKAGRVTREEMLIKLFELVNRKLSVDLSILAIVPYVLSARDPANGDYSVPAWDEEYKLTTLNNVLLGRSLGSLYGMGRVKSTTNFPVGEVHGKEEHMLDVILCPDEVLALEDEGYFGPRIG